MNYAPIAIFVYKRPDHTRKMMESLTKCPEFAHSPLYVFCDGAKKLEDQAAIDETRAVVRSIVGEKAMMIEADQNQGLANSIIAGVSKLLNEFDRVIVLEDDLIVSARFLAYMNTALETYQDESSVMQISGYMFPVKEFANQTEAIFLPFISSWGWGTWRNSWKCFDPNATGWEVLNRDEVMRTRFNLDRSYDYFGLLKDQVSGKADSWAIRWYWSVFKNNGCVLYPPVSHVGNTGFDGSGTHGWVSGKKFKYSYNETLIDSETFPASIQVNLNAFKLVQIFLRGGHSKIYFSVRKLARKILLLAK
jgi:hypothetical protein